MRRFSLVFMVVALMFTVNAAATELISVHSQNAPEATNPAHTDFDAKLRAMYPQKDLDQGVYVGDEYCIACHGWSTITRDAKHRKALRTPMGANTLVDGKGVVADYDKNGVDDFMQGLDFNQIDSVFDAYKPNAPILGYDAATDTYTMTIAGVTSWVVVTQGGTGDWKQRYLVAVPATGIPGGYAKDNYVSPLQYNEKTDAWVSYHPEHWWDENGAPTITPGTSVVEVAAVGRSYSKRCIGCHTTGFRDLGQDGNGEWLYTPYPASLVSPTTAEQYPDYDRDGIADIINIGCEACHGPGSMHVLGGGDPEYILAPSELETDAANEICQQCHIRTSSVPSGTFGFPFRDDVMAYWQPGITEGPITDFYEDHAGLWPDGKTSKQHHQQHKDFYNSSKPTFAFHPVKCTECHSPHSSSGKHMIRTRIVDEGVTIATENDNNTLCLACHATHGDFEEITIEEVANYYDNLDKIGNIVSAHSKHPYAPERSMGLSRCSKCHMPKTAKSAINYDVHGHTFEVIPPEKTLMYNEDGGMPNSCAVSCHGGLVNSFGLGLDPSWGDWATQFNVALSEALMTYFGPGGSWWDTADPKSTTFKHMEMALVPGTPVEEVPDIANE